jgi:hypothetical protein
MKADLNHSSCANAGETAMSTITIKILEPDRQSQVASWGTPRFISPAESSMA